MWSILLVLLCACGKNKAEDGVVDCAAYAGLASAEELVSTPRAHPELEILAIVLDGTFLAAQETYDRLDADVAAIRRDYPELAEVEDVQDIDGRSIWVWNIDYVTAYELQVGSLDATACANERYGWVGTDNYIGSLLELHFAGTYDTVALADVYGALIGGDGTRTQAVLSAADGDHVCVLRDGETWHYRVDRAWGICNLECEYNRWTWLTSDLAGAPVWQDDWGWTEEESGAVLDAEDQPTWLSWDWVCA